MLDTGTVMWVLLSCMMLKLSLHISSIAAQAAAVCPTDSTALLIDTAWQ